MLGLFPRVIFAVLDQHFWAFLRCRPVLWNWGRIKGSGFVSILENEKPIAPEPLRTISNVNLAERPWWRKINSNPSAVANCCVDRGKSAGARRGGDDARGTESFPVRLKTLCEPVFQRKVCDVLKMTGVMRHKCRAMAFRDGGDQGVLFSCRPAYTQ